MRSLPRPRRSRSRLLRRLLRYLYRIATLQFLFHRSPRGTVTIKRRRSPFHRSSRRYKVKLKGKRDHWWRFHLVRRNIVLDAQVLGELSRGLEMIAVSDEALITGRHKMRHRDRVRSVLRMRVLARKALRWMRRGSGIFKRPRVVRGSQVGTFVV